MKLEEQGETGKKKKRRTVVFVNVTPLGSDHLEWREGYYSVECTSRLPRGRGRVKARHRARENVLCNPVDRGSFCRYWHGSIDEGHSAIEQSEPFEDHSLI